MTLDPGKMDGEEYQRVLALRRSARSRPHLTAGGQSGAATRTERKRLSAWRTLYARPTVLAYSSAHALGDAMRKVMVDRIEHQLRQGTPMVHVKNGVPLTEHGAQLLGVAWPAPEVSNAA